mgnify:CR=1 FL=1
MLSMIAEADPADRAALFEQFRVDISAHAAAEEQAKAGLEHVALLVPTVTQLQQWHHDLADRGLDPSPITAWKFGTFIDITGPEELTVRLFVPAVR